MKKTFIISALLAGSLSAYSQGTVTFTDTTSSFKAHIYSPSPGNASVETQGLGAGDAPTAGSTVYTGQLIGTGNTSTVGGFNYSSSTYTVQLYAAPGDNVALGSLSPVTQYITTIYTSGASSLAGEFKPVNLGASDPGIPNTPNGIATVALAAWYNPGGDTYATESAAASAGVPAGFSLPGNDNSLGGIGTATPSTLAAAGISSFSLAIVPEPSTIALGVIGASTFLFRRRK